MDEAALVIIGGLLTLLGTLVGSLAMEKARFRREMRKALFLEQLPALRKSLLNHRASRIRIEDTQEAKAIQDATGVLSRKERKASAELSATVNKLFANQIMLDIYQEDDSDERDPRSEKWTPARAEESYKAAMDRISIVSAAVAAKLR